MHLYLVFCDINKQLSFQKLFQDVFWSHVHKRLNMNKNILYMSTNDKCIVNNSAVRNLRYLNKYHEY